ncbi:MAG: hypothetical protein OEW42_01850 [Acidimicrobiia bacterium]|nr:hypothetical protein [Acidimicrobiia bacterium]
MPYVGKAACEGGPTVLHRGLAIAGFTAICVVGCSSSGEDPVLVPDSTGVATTVANANRVELTEVDTIPADAPALVLATAAGITRWTPADGPMVVRELAEGVRHAVDDGAGGVVGLTVDDQLLGQVWWWPADGAPLLLRSQGGLALHDVTERNGEPGVLISYSPIDVSEPIQVLDLLDLATTSARTVRSVGDADSGAISAAASTNGFAVTQVEQDCVQVLLFDDAGEPLADPAVPEPMCGNDGVPGFGSVALADDGSLLAVAHVAPDGAPTVLTSASGSSELVELALDAGPTDITGLDVDAGYVVVATGDSTILIDTTASTWVDLGVAAHTVSVVAAP